MITAAGIRDHATDTLVQWLGGYTEPDPDSEEPQHRMRVESTGPGFLVLRVEGIPFSDEHGKDFRIVLLVEEL